jgi:hypothetical protein
LVRWERGRGIAERKGYNGMPFVVIFIALWFLGEIRGFVVGISATKNQNNNEIWAAYPYALGFAAGGAVIGLLIPLLLPSGQPTVRRKKKKKQFDSYGEPVRRRDSEENEYRRQPLRRRREEDQYYSRSRRRRRDVEEDQEDYEPRPRKRPRRPAVDDGD